MRVLALAVVGLGVFAANAYATFPGQDVLRLSDGAAPARHPVISHDKRFARLAAFESDAGGTTNVYVVRRAEGYGDNGTPWAVGSTQLASVGMGGQPANGPSTAPSLDGTSRVAPHCVAFVSAASNLVKGDTNGKPDAFVRDLRTGKTIRVSVNAKGRQSTGSVSEVAVNGLCTRVAFVSDAGDLALTKTKNPSWRSAVTRPSPAGRRQVYMRAFGGTTGIDRALKGLTFLVSATSKTPGNADSYGISFSVNAHGIAFASDATNLASGDDNGASDVFERFMARAYGRKQHGHRPQYLQLSTVLVSRNGRSASSSPAANVDGSLISYVTTAPELVGADPHGVPQVVQTKIGGGTKLISATASGGPGNGASTAPTTSDAGSWVAFQSAATDVGVLPTKRPDPNGLTDVQLVTPFDRWLIASDSASAPSSAPQMSPHGNYMVFERGGQVWFNYVGSK
jgi:hypothetical protein